MEKIQYDVPIILDELAQLGKERTKKTYLRHGAKEPLYGVTSGDLKPLAKRIGKYYKLAMQLYDSGNYDAMYLAGMIAEPKLMSEEDFEHWMKQAYCHMISDYIVAVTLAESPLAKKISDKWIASKKELYQSAGWSCYAWQIGNLPDEHFEKDKIKQYLDHVEKSIHKEENRVRYAMNSFVIAVGISFRPLHKEALEAAQRYGRVEVNQGDTKCNTPLASAYIKEAEKKERIGFKRKNVRC